MIADRLRWMLTARLRCGWHRQECLCYLEAVDWGEVGYPEAGDSRAD
jgi:hypothetical protein